MVSVDGGPSPVDGHDRYSKSPRQRVSAPLRQYLNTIIIRFLFGFSATLRPSTYGREIGRTKNAAGVNLINDIVDFGEASAIVTVNQLVSVFFILFFTHAHTYDSLLTTNYYTCNTCHSLSFNECHKRCARNVRAVTVWIRYRFWFQCSSKTARPVSSARTPSVPRGHLQIVNRGHAATSRCALTQQMPLCSDASSDGGVVRH